VNTLPKGRYVRYASCDFSDQEIQNRISNLDQSNQPYATHLFFRQSPFRRFSQTSQPKIQIEIFDETVEVEIV